MLEDIDKEEGKLVTRENISNDNAIIFDENLDETSGYTSVYMTAVYHDDIETLKSKLKEHYTQINNKGKITNENYKEINNIDNFEKDIQDINFENQPFLYKDEILNEENRDRLFNYSVCVASLSALIQFIFSFTIIQEYHNDPIKLTSDHELITIRLLAFIALSVNIWIEYKNGRKKVNHAIYQKFLYRSNYKRIISGIFGVVQILVAFICYFCSSELIVRTETVIDCAIDFTSLLIIIEIDDWIGEYFLFTSDDIREYTRDNITQIWCIDKNYLKHHNNVERFEDFCCIICFLIVLIPIYESVNF